VIVAANAALIGFALSSWTGITAEGVFRQTSGFNDELAGARAQAALGWTADVRFRAAGDRAGTLTVTVLDAAGVPLQGAKVTATFERPTLDGLDFPAVLAPGAAGAYAAATRFPLAGQWDVNLLVERDGQTFRLLRRLFVPA
jgi:nitrogen fixation protein FixH